MKDLYDYLLLLGDNPLIIGHRLSELCGHGPTLETDIALTNISLDLFGQVRNYFQYAAEVKGDGATEDSIAMLRQPNQYRHVNLMEQPNKDFAWVMARQFFFDAYHQPLLQQLMGSQDERIAAIAAKSSKEVAYHLDVSQAWMLRLGDGSDESHQRMQTAVNYLLPFAIELMEPTEVEQRMQAAGIGADLAEVRKAFDQTVDQTLAEATLTQPDLTFIQRGGKQGRHTEHLGYLLSELQYMQRAYPEMEW
jgi:ring-1,2-phenylacetyl-CoA epoxidase subunit PaaC